LNICNVRITNYFTNRVGLWKMETDPTPFGWEIINGPAYSTPADDLSNVFTWWNHNRDSEYLPQRRKERKKIKLSVETRHMASEMPNLHVLKL
jgi:hypothetical protein